MLRTTLAPLLGLAAGLAVLLAIPATSEASSRSKAMRLYRRIAGMPPTPDQVTQMAKLIDAGQLEQAARIPIDSPDFINSGAKRLVVSLTDPYQSTQRTFHFSSALMLGLIRDDLPFDQALYGDTFYVGDPKITSPVTWEKDPSTRRVLDPAYAVNAHHFDLLDSTSNAAPYAYGLINPSNLDDTYPPNLTQRIFTSDLLVKVQQDGFEDPYYERNNEVAWKLQPPYSGVLTAPDFGQAYYTAGTNRRPIKFLMQNFLCKSLDQLMDVSLSDSWVRRDVDRSPGGDSRTYKQRCIGCHSGIDAISGAFAYYDVNIGIGYLADIRSYGQNQITPYDPKSPLGYVQTKMNRNFVNYPAGHPVSDASWVNMWVGPKYADIGWRGAMSGNGVQELGRMLARSEAFANCMTSHVFEQVCQREPVASEQADVKALARQWESELGYNMKKLVAKVSSHPACLGTEAP